MKNRLQARLEELREEQLKGEQLLAFHQSKVNDLQQQLWRVIGAIQILSELLAEEEQTQSPSQ